MINNTFSTPSIIAPIQDYIGSQPIDVPYMPLEALVNSKPGVNEFTGNYFNINMYPLEYGKEKDGSSGCYVSGYALHEEDESYSSMVIGGIPSTLIWNDVFDSSCGFLITFQYSGYSDVYRKAYGIYVCHELTPDDFDQYS